MRVIIQADAVRLRVKATVKTRMRDEDEHAKVLHLARAQEAIPIGAKFRVVHTAVVQQRRHRHRTLVPHLSDIPNFTATVE